jgi:ribosome-binding factor A
MRSLSIDLIICEVKMASNLRINKIGDQVKQELALIIDQKVKDPKKGFITITRVRMSPDLRLASVYFSVLGKNESANESLEVLNRAKAFLRSQLSDRLKLRHLPELRFFYDDSLEYSEKISRLINKIHKDESVE